MKSLFTIFMFLGLFLAPLTGNAQKGKIHKAKISFVFVSKDVKGTFSGFESTSQVDLNNLEASDFQGSVLSKTIDTNNGLRNWSLRSGKYFDVDDYPKISFQSTQVYTSGDNLKVKGDLTIKETTKPVTITFHKSQNKLVGNTSLNSMDYGLKIKKKRDDNLVNITMEFDIE